jgi:hypothetical protein
MDRPLKATEQDAILYLKLEIPTAPERTGLIPMDPRPPGQRCAEDIALLSQPGLFLSDHVEVGKKSYWLTVREPWTEELEEEEIKSFEDLLELARVWAVSAGATHRQGEQPKIIGKRMTPELTAELKDRSRAYLYQMDRDYRSFASDPRVSPLVRQANSLFPQSAPPANRDDD